MKNLISVGSGVAWLLAYHMGLEIKISNQPEMEDVCMMNLNQLMECDPNSITSKYLITFGNEKINFDLIKAQLGNTVWINYYGRTDRALRSLAGRPGRTPGHAQPKATASESACRAGPS